MHAHHEVICTLVTCVVRVILHSAVTPMDYNRELFTILSFSACETRQCVDVAIVDDIMNEPEEEFNVTLERTPDLDSRITLDPDNGKIFIQDDGKYALLPKSSHR